MALRMRCVQLECSGSSLVCRLRRARQLSNECEVTVSVDPDPGHRLRYHVGINSKLSVNTVRHYMI